METERLCLGARLVGLLASGRLVEGKGEGARQRWIELGVARDARAALLSLREGTARIARGSALRASIVDATLRSG